MSDGLRDMPSAIIIGAMGQDGTYLYRLLDEKKYLIYSIGRQRSLTNNNDWTGFDHPDITNPEEVLDIVRKVRPDEIYHLAAVHQSSEDPVADPVTLFIQSYDVNVMSLLNVLEAIRQISPKTRLFYAASSHIFGRPEQEPQDENTSFNPLSIYGITKASGIFLCRMYRSAHGIFSSVGILYNHESPLRGEQFVSQKIVQGAVRCKKDPGHRLVLGDLSVEVDWGYAPDYVEAMHRIICLPEPDDFVIATGEKHRVEDFVRIAFESVGLNWQDFVKERENIITRPSVGFVGSPAKLIKRTGWNRSVAFDEMVKLLVTSAEEHEEE
jgi:GDPmannose 4,6-dehydratase